MSTECPVRRFCCQIVGLGQVVIVYLRPSAAHLVPLPSTPVLRKVTLQVSSFVSPRPRCALFRASESVGRAERVQSCWRPHTPPAWSLHTQSDALPTLTPPDRGLSLPPPFSVGISNPYAEDDPEAGRGF